MQAIRMVTPGTPASTAKPLRNAMPRIGRIAITMMKRTTATTVMIA